MRIMKADLITSYQWLNIYKERLYHLISVYDKTHALDEIKRMYGEDMIIKAVDSIYIDSDGYVNIPSIGTYSTILRLLQYGGYKTKGLNMLTTAMGGGII